MGGTLGYLHTPGGSGVAECREGMSRRGIGEMTTTTTLRYTDNYCGPVWRTVIVPVESLAETLSALECSHPAASLPVLAYIGGERILVAWRHWARPVEEEEEG